MMRFLSRSLAAPVLVLALLGLCLGASMASAQVPHDMSYQGRLTDSVGAPLAGPVDLELRIYDVLSGGVALFAENHAVVPLDDDGGFNLLLGSGAATTGTFDASLFAGVNRYLEVVIDGEVLSPRLPFSSVPYAMVAEEAAVVQGAPTLITDVQTLQTQVGSPAPGDPSVVDRLTSQGVTIGTNTVAATTAQASADSASTTAAAAQSTATANEAALTALQATLPSLQDLSGQDLTGQDLSGQDLSMANLVGTILVNADLRGANLYRANLSGADLNGADLRGANLDEALLVLTDLRQTRVGLSGGISTSMNNATVTVGPDADTGGGSYSYQVELIAESDQCVLTGLGIPCLSANGAVFSGGGGPQTTVILPPNTQAVGASFLLDEFSQVSCTGGSDFSGSVVAPHVVFSANECTAAGLKAPGAHYQGWGIAPNSDLRGSLVELTNSFLPGSMPPDLSGSNLAGAHLRLVGANVGTLLEGADLTGAWIDSTQIGSSPTVSFRSANLTNIELCDVVNPDCLPLSSLEGFDFADATLSGVNFIRYYKGLLPASLDGVDLSDATLADHAQGLGVNLSGFGADYLASAVLPQTMAFTNLSGLDLSSRDLSQFDFRQATLIGTDFTGANLTGAQFAGANLTDVILTGAILSDADLTGANLAGADVGGANFSGATLANVTGTTLTNAGGSPTVFAGANLAGATLGGNLDGANLRGADLSGTDVAAASLAGADISGAAVATTTGLDFSEVTLSNIEDLSGKDLSNVDLSGQNLSFFNFAGANLTEANLSEANLYRADLTGANLYRTNLRSANLDGAVLKDASISDAFVGDTETGHCGQDKCPTSMINANVSFSISSYSPDFYESAASAGMNTNCVNSGLPLPGDCLVADGADFTNRAFLPDWLQGWSGVRALGAIFRDTVGFSCGASDYSGSDFSGAVLFAGWDDVGTCVARGASMVDHTNDIGRGLGTWPSFEPETIKGDLRDSDWSRAALSGYTLAANLASSNFTSADLTDAILSGDLTGATLGSADLTGATLSGSLANANLRGAILYELVASTAGGATPSLAGADLRSALINCTANDANCTHPVAQLAGADLSYAKLDGFYLAAYTGADAVHAPQTLAGADLSQAVLSDTDAAQGVDLSGRVGALAGATLPRRLAHTNLSGHDFSGLDLNGVDLRQATLIGTDFTGANLTGTQLGGANLTNAILTGTILSEADLASANLAGAAVGGADFSGASLAGATATGLTNTGGSPTDFAGANLAGATLGGNLDGANLRGADLSGTNVAAASLAGADISGAVVATTTGLDLAEVSVTAFQDLAGKDLSGQDLSGQNLSFFNLAGANLTGANLSGANFYRANLSGANLTVADLRGANLDEADLTSSVLQQTIIGNQGPDSPTRMSGVNFSNALVLLNSSGSGCPAPGTCLVANGSDFSGALQVTLGSGVEAIGATFGEIGCEHNSDFSQSTVNGSFSSAPSCVANGLVANNISSGPLDGTHRNSSFKNSDLASGGTINGDLSGSNFSGSDLYVGTGVLDGANLTAARIGSAATGGSLVSADLTNLVAFCPLGSSLPTCDGGGQEFVASAFQVLNLSGATLAGVNLSRHSSSQLPYSLSNADLSNAILGDFEAGQGADFSGRVGSLAGALLPTSLAYTNLSGHDLSGRNFANADLREAILTGTNLSGANLTGARLSGINLAGADLTGAVLANADLTGASLSGATLAGTDFSGATLDGANLTSIENQMLEPTNFSGASMVGAFLGGLFTAADFRNANLTGADLAPVTVPTIDAASLVGANFTGASLVNALGLGQADTEQIDFTGANLEGIDLTTLAPNIICPDGTTASTNPSSNCVGHIIAGIEAAVYTTLQPEIVAKKIAILDNDSDIASNAAAVVTERDRALAAEGANNSAIASNDTDIAANAAAIGTEMDRALGAEGANNSAIASNDTGIAANAAAVSAEETRALAAEGVNAVAIGAEVVRAVGAEESNALEINDLIDELDLEIVGSNDARVSFTGNWSTDDGWGANQLSTQARLTSCSGDTDCSAATITLDLDSNTWSSVLISVLDWHSSRYFDVYVSFDGGVNFTFHQRIESHREQHSQPHVSSIQTLVSNLPQGQDVQVRVEATRGRLHFEGFALSHATLPEIPRKTLAVRNSDGAISGNYTFDGTLDLSIDSDVSATGGSGSLSIGPASGTNIGIDGNEIMARDGSAYSSLHLNANGGDVMIGSNPTGTPPDLVLSGNADIAGSALLGFERISAAGATHASVPSTCSFGGSSYSCYIGSATVFCGAGKVVLGGGCSCGTSAGGSTGYSQTCHGYPWTDTSFRCNSYSTASSAPFSAYAICARMGN